MLDPGFTREVNVMACPPEISEILLKILETGLLRIRTLAWAGQVDRCAIEADHIHNLPSLLADFSPERLTYYWGIERPSYIARILDDELEDWERLWRRLQPYVGLVDAPTATP
jgi:hypothetical protein